MDAALLLVAGNEVCPQPQTPEQLFTAVEIMPCGASSFCRTRCFGWRAMHEQIKKFVAYPRARLYLEAQASCHLFIWCEYAWWRHGEFQGWRHRWLYSGGYAAGPATRLKCARYCQQGRGRQDDLRLYCVSRRPLGCRQRGRNSFLIWILRLKEDRFMKHIRDPNDDNLLNSS